MSAPAEEVAKDGVDLDRIQHKWCMRCLPRSPLPARAFCGFTTTERSSAGGARETGPICVVCADLVFSGCERCG